MARGSKTTLNELMGKRGESFERSGVELDDLPDLLGEHMPKLEFHALGRVRLIQALRARFGDNYRNLPGVSEVLQKFDEKAHTALQHHLILKRLGRK